ncbi:uncharacterized protein DS421_11g343080 [Arachis hypogaea]|nr:uncharacterized protein DS421_11g343080 [Arachis hypogaea]
MSSSFSTILSHSQELSSTFVVTVSRRPPSQCRTTHLPPQPSLSHSNIVEAEARSLNLFCHRCATRQPWSCYRATREPPSLFVLPLLSFGTVLSLSHGDFFLFF